MIPADQVKQLRDRTGAGMMECKKALSATGGDVDKAVDALRKSGAVKAESRSGRDAREVVVEAYIPGNRVGVLSEVTARLTSSRARRSSRSCTQHRDAGGRRRRRVRAARRDSGRAHRTRARRLSRSARGKKAAGDPREIVEGKLEKFYAELCLMEQPFIRDDQRRSATW